MERTLLSFLAGAASITLAVIATGAYTVTFFSLGFLAAIAIGYLAFRLIGRRRLAAWLVGRPAAAPAIREHRTAAGRRVRPVTDETLYARYQRMPKKEKMRLELEAWNEAFEHGAAEPAAASPEAVEMFSQSAPSEPATGSQGALFTTERKVA
jgi:hypothetical protein